MTTQTTTTQPSTRGMRALIGAAAASLALLGGAVLWQARPTSEPVTPVASTTMSRTSHEDVAPLGGMAELYRAQELTRRPLAAETPGAMGDGCGLDTHTRAC